MENLIVALTNYTCVYPIYTSISNNDYTTTLCITFVALFSFLSHLVENHKHNMPGIGVSKKWSIILNKLDVLGCWIVIIRICCLYCVIHGFDFNILLKNYYLLLVYVNLLIILKESETDVHNKNLKFGYILLHSVWHLCVFMLLNQFLMDVIYL